MRYTPFCRECIYYVKKGYCKLILEKCPLKHITSEFWCINGIKK